MQLLDGHAIIRIDAGSEKTAEQIMQALIPETTSSPTDRARVDLDTTGKTLTIHIRAGDLTALRAAINSYLSWTWGGIRTIKSVTGQNP